MHYCLSLNDIQTIYSSYQNTYFFIFFVVRIPPSSIVTYLSIYNGNLRINIKFGKIKNLNLKKKRYKNKQTRQINIRHTFCGGAV